MEKYLITEENLDECLHALTRSIIENNAELAISLCKALIECGFYMELKETYRPLAFFSGDNEAYQKVNSYSHLGW